MKNILVALLLLDITKRDLKLVCALQTLYINRKEKDRQIFKIRDLSTLTGLTSTNVVDSLEELIDFNIVGKIVLDGQITRKIKQGLNTNFLQTLTAISMKEKLKEAVDRVGYYVTDDTCIYIFNPVSSSWKYLKWAKVEKALKLLEETIENNDLVTNLVKNKNTTRNKLDQTVQGISIKTCLVAFCDKFKEIYGTVYSLNYRVEQVLIKSLLKQLIGNGLVKLNDYIKFLDWAFLQSKEKGKVIHIANLKYLANEYLAETKPNSKYYYDDEGVLREKK